MFAKLLILTASFLLASSAAIASDLNGLIAEVYQRNPQLKSMQSRVDAAGYRASAATALPDPAIGITQLKRGATTQYWTIGQKIEFPTKYGLRRDVELARQDAQSQSYQQVRVQLRSELVTLYFKLYANTKITELTNDELTNVGEFSRIAESKYAAGQAPMHDSMKSHFLQTKIESDLIMLADERQALLAQIATLLDRDTQEVKVDFPKDLPEPKFDPSQAKLWKNSYLIQQKVAEQRVAATAANLTRWDYAPDFGLRYQGRLGGEPEDSHSIMVEMTVPVWFWGASGRNDAANSSVAAQDYALANTIHTVKLRARELVSRVNSQIATLKIMSTGLIPQAQTSYDSAFDGYKANKVSFLELLDAERTLLEVRKNYYRMLVDYVGNLTKLEAMLGVRASDLPQ